MIGYSNVLAVWRYYLFTIFGVLLWVSLSAADDKHQSNVNCDIQNSVCSQNIGDRKVTLQVLPKPVKAMEELTFQVTLAQVPEKLQPYIDLNMPAMNMGENRVLLKRDGKGVYTGKGVIVRCRSGRRTWSANVTFPNLGSAEFIFDVIY